MKALLIGTSPVGLSYEYTREPPFDAVVVGSMSLHQALSIPDERILSALAQGKPVEIYTPGLPQAPKNRALAASLSASYRQMKNWGIRFTDGAQKHLITAQMAKAIRQSGTAPAPGAVLTPLARELLEGLV